MMIFNGLKGCDLATYNYLLNSDLSERISATQIADGTCYSPPAILCSLQRLVEWGLIERERRTRGQAYKFRVKEDDISHTIT